MPRIGTRKLFSKEDMKLNPRAYTWTPRGTIKLTIPSTKSAEDWKRYLKPEWR